MTIKDEEFYKHKMWFQFSRWTWIRLAFLFVVVMSSLGLFSVQKNGEDDIARFRQIALEQCERGNNVRQVIRDVVTVTYNSGETINITAFPSYDELDDATKIYITDLNKALESSTTPQAKQQRIDDALAQVPLINCPEVSK